ncbi:TPA: DUF2283 domain-containing protein [Candidatus Woesearchaeota archaeon]|nr:DUF2283 domain-containing protein [Candidatus Woesearchaeota archaeon]HIH13555.1 DUF2283 domain-containing protein [Candidatus Woesearchaeota archaeon]
MKTKHLDAKGKGEMDYDYTEDTLFFKVKERDYDHSIELEDVVLDIDKEGYITGIQIFGASKMFNVDKDTLRNVQKWEFTVRTEGKIIFIQLIFEMLRRNQIVERGQNLVRESSTLLTDSEVRCAMSA